MRRALILSLLASFFCAESSRGEVEFGIMPFTGLMQQPTSQYFHLIYGGRLQVAARGSGSVFAGLGFSADFFQRPTFKERGFEDGEQGVFGHLRQELFSSSWQRLESGLGYGQIRGFIRSSETVEGREAQSYELNGPSAELTYSLVFSSVHLSLANQLFVGLNGGDNVRSYVGWPYHFAKLGVQIAF